MDSDVAPNAIGRHSHYNTMVRESTTTLGVTSVALVLTVPVWFTYPAVRPQVLDEWGLTGLDAGIVLAAFQAGYLLVIVPAGMLADRYSERWLVAVGALGTGLASLAFAFGARGFLSGTALRFVAGLFMVGVYVPGMRFVSSWFPTETRGRAFGVYVGAYSTSSSVSFLAASSVAAAVDWRTAIAVTSVGALLAAPLFSPLPTTRRTRVSRLLPSQMAGNDTKARTTLQTTRPASPCCGIGGISSR